MKPTLTKNHSENTPVLPYLCEPTTLLSLIIMGELLALVLMLAGAHGAFAFSWTDFGMASLLIQWIILVSTATLCQLRPWLNSLSPRLNGSLAYGLCVLIAGVTLWLANHFFTPLSPSHWLPSLLIAAIIAGILLRYLWLQQQLRNREKAEQDARFDVLQARIHPHFLFNSMNSIASLIPVDPKAAEQTVEDLSILFRASLSAPSLIPLKQELDLCERYLAIEKVRLGERCKIEWEVETPIPNIKIPSLLLQPLFENAIVHGIQSSTQGGVIRFTLALSQKVMTLHLSNPLPEQEAKPKNPSAQSSGNQMAHSNIRHRLSSHYDTKAKMRVDRNTANNTYVIILTLPLTDN